MKTPLTYPKIPDCSGYKPKKCIAFYKYDGTNFHFDYNAEKGWHSFGTRRTSFDLSEDGIKEFNSIHRGLSEVTNIFENEFKILDKYNNYFYAGRYSKLTKNYTIFTEFFGENSFAGAHKTDDPKKLILIDIKTDVGFVSPKEFVLDFMSGMYLPLKNVAKVIYTGKYNGQFIQDIRNGKYLVNEGVVCKEMYRDKIYMTKIKTNSYMKRLKEEFKDNWKEYWE